MTQRDYLKQLRHTAMCAALLILAGCQGNSRVPDAEKKFVVDVSRIRAQPTERRIDALSGSPMLVPIRLSPVTAPGGGTKIDVSIDGVEPIEADLFWISASRSKSTTQYDPLAGWVAQPKSWSAKSPEQMVTGAAPSGEGFWALLIEPPREAQGRSLFIDGVAAPVRWLSMPETNNPTHPSRADLFQERSATLRRTLLNASRDPLNRWRTELLDDRLRAPRQTVIDAHATLFDHEAIELMAQQAAWRWRLALDHLSSIDPFLGAALLDRLTAIARFDEQTQAPVWPTDEAALNSLRTALLDPDLPDTSKVALTRDTLDSSRSSTAWIIDDAGWVEPTTGRTVVLLGVADRLDQAGLVRGSIGDRKGPSVSLPSLGVARATVQATTLNPGELPSPSEVTLNVIGRESTALPALPVGLPVQPPGFSLGPGWAPWTLTSWSNGSAFAAAQQLSFYALLHRRAPTESTGSQWQLHVECPTPSGAEPGFLRVYLGPSNAPIARLRIDPAGLQTEEIKAAMERDPVSITSTDDMWIATIDIPQSAIEPGGILRIAVERYDSNGARATWPRPVLPWQQSPGRAALNLLAWNGLTPTVD